MAIKNPLKKARRMNLHDLFMMKLQALYDVETQLVKALPKMAKHATDSELRTAFEDHLKVTEGHVARLEGIFAAFDEKPKKLKVEGMRGIIEDAEWVAQTVGKGTALDAALIASAAYVENYEIAGYGTAVEWADLMEHTQAVEMLELTLEEEQAASDTLTALAASKINQEALGSDENTEDEETMAEES